MCRFLLLACNILIAVTIANTARILAVFPTPSLSHQIVFRVLTLELAKRGHEVTVITTDPAYPKDRAPANLTEIDLHNISYRFYHKVIAELTNNKFEIGKRSEWISQLPYIQIFYNIIEEQSKHDEVQKLIREKREFDLLLIEAFVRPAIVFSYIFKAPVIQVSSFGAMIDSLEAIGASTHPIFYPLPIRRRLYGLTLWEKIKKYYYHMQLMHIRMANEHTENVMLQRIYGANVPPINDLMRNVDMLFLNVHPIWMDNQPMPPNVVFMGGLQQKPIKDLPQNIKSYLDKSKNGVIYVSFGTNVHPIMFPPEKLQVLTDTFSELPYDILFKWNDDELPGRSENVKISKWLPQSDLLRHPNVKAFVMQGGLQSTDEAITAGVPLVCIPMIGDQWYNAEKYVKLKIGVQLDFISITKSQFKKAIETVIEDKSYRENLVRLRDRMNDQPQTPLERAVWWVEYVLRHGGARHLRAPTANMSWTEYYELELVVAVLIIVFIVSAIILYGIMSLWCSIFPRNVVNNFKMKDS